MIVRRVWRKRAFWLLLLLLVIVPTAAVLFLAYEKGSGGLAQRISEAISRQAGVHVTIEDVVLDDLSIRSVTLEGLAVHNPLEKKYPFLDAGTVKVEGIQPSKASISNARVTLSSYTIAIPATGSSSSSSGEAIRQAARTVLETFTGTGMLSSLELGTGRILIVMEDSTIELAISSGTLKTAEGGSVTGNISISSWNSDKVDLRLDMLLSGRPEEPGVQMKLEANGMDLSSITPLLPDGDSLGGQITASFSFKAGLPGKDTVELEATCKGLKLTSGDATASIAQGRLTASFSSESGTFPDLNSLLMDPFDPDHTTSYQADFSNGEILFQGVSVNALSLSASSGKGSISVATGRFQVKNSDITTTGEGTRLALSKPDGAYKFQTVEPATDISFQSPFGALSLKECEGEVELKGSATAFDLTAVPVSGGGIEFFGRFSTISPQPLGTVGLRLDAVAFSVLTAFGKPEFSGVKFDCSHVTGSVEVEMGGWDSVSGTATLKAADSRLAGSSFDLQQPEAIVSTDFRFGKGSVFELRKTRFELGSFFSMLGSARVEDGVLKSVVLDSGTVSCSQLCSILRRNTATTGVWEFEGGIGIQGEFKDFDSNGLPSRAMLQLTVVDEFTFRLNDKDSRLLIKGVTGSVSLMGTTSDSRLSVKLDGKFLPQTVTWNDSRLFLSSQQALLSGSFRYSPESSLLDIERFRIESETGLNEEVSGSIRFSADPVLDLKIRDWGLTLEQVLQLVEVPTSMKLNGGVFVLERTVSGPLSNVQSKYKLTVNGMSIDTTSVKVKGAGLLIEFP